MIPPRFLSDDGSKGMSWEDLGIGAPTIIGFARLCSNRLASGVQPWHELSVEAKAILFAARERGVIEIMGSNNAFDATDRFLSVHVELDPDTSLAFKSKQDPARTISYLDAFRELCAAGLVFHHLHREFSLTHDGFKLASTVARDDVEAALSFGVEYGRGEI